MQELFTMGQVAKQLGVTKNTLARWEEKWKREGLKDLLPRRDHNKHRVYTAKQVKEILKRKPVQESALFLARPKKVKDDEATAGAE